MAPILAILFTPIIHIITLLITSASAYYVYKQETTGYPQVKSLLLYVHLLFLAIVGFELVRNFTADPVFMTIYTISNTTFVLADVMLLTFVSLAIYLRPAGSKVTDILSEIGKHRGHAAVLGAVVAYIALVEVTLFAAKPFTINLELINAVGNVVPATIFTSYFLSMLFVVLAIFIAYPSTLLFLARRRTRDPAVRRALLLLPVAWMGIGLDLLIFNGYLLTVGVDASALGYLFATSAFTVSAAIFRGATLLSGFFGPIQVGGERGVTTGTIAKASARSFSARLGRTLPSIIGKNILLGVESTANFEEAVADAAAEYSAAGLPVFVYTIRGSPVYTALSRVEGVRFYILNAKVSYPRPGDHSNEILVPQSDYAVLLNVLDKTVSSNPDAGLLVVFDSISDLMLSSSLEGTYKFLKQANEIISGAKISAIFLFTEGAHTEREDNVVKSLFSNQVRCLTHGLQVDKMETQ